MDRPNGIHCHGRQAGHAAGREPAGNGQARRELEAGSGGSWPAPRCCAYTGFLADNFVASGIRKWPYSDAARLFSDRWVLERYCVMASFEPYVEK